MSMLRVQEAVTERAMWTRAAVVIGVLGGLAQILQWIETSRWLRQVFPAGVRLVSEHTAILGGVVNLAIIALLVIGVLKVRQLEHKQAVDDQDVRVKMGSLETRVWDELNKSLPTVRGNIQTQFDELLAEVRKQIEQRQRDLDRDFQNRIVKLKRTVGLRPPEQNMFRTHDGHEFTWEHLAELPDAQLADAFKKYQGLSEWYDRETSDRMGPPGRIGQPWPNLEKVFYREVEREGVKAWTFGEVARLPIPEREKLKTRKPELWKAYWEEVLRRSEYVLPDGAALAKTTIARMTRDELDQLTKRDPDILEWALHGQQF